MRGRTGRASTRRVIFGLVAAVSVVGASGCMFTDDGFPSAGEVERLAYAATIEGYPSVFFYGLWRGPRLEQQVNDLVHQSEYNIRESRWEMATDFAGAVRGILFGVLDLRDGPVRISLPDWEDRFRVLGLYGHDADPLWLSEPGLDSPSEILVMRAGQQAPVLTGTEVVVVSTASFAVFLGQIAAQPDDTQAEWNALMGSAEVVAPAPMRDYSGTPPVGERELNTPAFFQVMNVLWNATDRGRTSEPTMESAFAHIGIGPGMIFPAELMSEQTRQAVARGFVAAKQDIDDRIRELEVDVDGWNHVRLPLDMTPLDRAARGIVRVTLPPPTFVQQFSRANDSNGDPFRGHREYTLTITDADIPPAAVGVLVSTTPGERPTNGWDGYPGPGEVTRFIPRDVLMEAGEIEVYVGPEPGDREWAMRTVEGEFRLIFTVFRGDEPLRVEAAPPTVR